MLTIHAYAVENPIQRRLNMKFCTRSRQLRWFLFSVIILTLGNFFGCSDGDGEKKGDLSVRKELQAKITYYAMPG